MDTDALAGMIFTLILIAMVGGFVLLLPLSRRLGALLERRLEGHPVDDATAAELKRLRETVTGLQQQVEELSERQAFTDALLHSRAEAPALGSGRTPAAGE